jgi:hypothetical protein
MAVERSPAPLRQDVHGRGNLRAMRRGALFRRFVLLATVGAAQPLPAAGVASYAVDTLPVAAGIADLEFPLAGQVKAQTTILFFSQGDPDSGNPFAHLSLISPALLLHYDGITNVRLSAGFQEMAGLAISSLGVPSSHEERLVARARLQQPRGSSAIYEMLQFDLRSLEDAAGVHRWVFRPRFRVGSGFNLDATRIHSLVLYQEVAVRFAEAAYTTRAFDFYRAVVGYTWTTRRGIFVTAGLIGQLQLNPAGTRLDFLYGPLLSFAYRILPEAKPAEPAPAETPPEPPELETP